MPERQILIYGATGYVGALLVRRARASGIDVIVAGRSTKTVSKMAEEMSFPSRVGDIEAIDLGDVPPFDGQSVQATLTTPDAYVHSVDAALTCARTVVERGATPGFRTPAQEFGVDFVLQLPGVTSRFGP